MSLIRGGRSFEVHDRRNFTLHLLDQGVILRQRLEPTKLLPKFLQSRNLRFLLLGIQLGVVLDLGDMRADGLGQLAGLLALQRISIAHRDRRADNRPIVEILEAIRGRHFRHGGALAPRRSPNPAAWC